MIDLAIRWSLKTTLLALTLICAAGTASAQDGLADLDLGVGVMGLVQGNFLDQPTDMSIPGQTAELIYPGFGGVGGGGGISVDLRYKGFVGLEMDLYVSSDRGAGFIDLLRISIGQTAWHVPLIAKLLYPGETVRPMLTFGVEFVIPQSLKVTTDPVLPSNATLFGGRAGAYAMLQAGVGIEFALPFSEIDLRIPVMIRGSLNPATPGASRDRADYDLAGIQVRSVIFVSEWQYHIGASLGLAWYLF